METDLNMNLKALKYLYAFFLMCLSVVLSSALDHGPSPHTFSCDRERKVLTGKYGTISSGNKEYPMDSHCEWLIRASDEKSYITLTFMKMDTECSYDHVFIYNGNSYASPLLGSFSGNTTPPSVTTTQGAMLILLYSDTNYVRSGFEATYSVTDCPLNCSYRGLCQNHHCICDTLWSGDACEISLCPSDCGIEENKGECNLNGSEPARCECHPGYSGMDCSLPDSNKNGGNSWYLISTSGITARASHTGTYVQHTDSFYVFGGYTFKKVLGDTLVFSFKENRWTNITTKLAPSPRHGHATVCYHDNIILFGGELENGTLSNELWFFNVSSLQWNLMVPKNHFMPPPLTKHSVTLVDFYWLYIIGGSLSDGTFSSKMYRINIRDMNGWEVVDSYGGKESTLRLVGHSAVYHQQTKTIFVFGGITAEYSHVSKLTNHLYAFHVEKKYWIKIKYERNHFTPLERAFHTAAIVGDYMIIYGGYTHKHVEEEICYDNETHLYHLRCHKWIDISNLRKDFIGSNNPISHGVFSHTMGVRRGHTLVIFGGYSGLMRSQLLAYVLPSAVLSDQLLLSTCSRHSSQESCLSNLACGWCSDSNTCVERKSSKQACKKFSSDTCPGLCSALSDCFSCLIWGQSFVENLISDRQDPFPPFSCTWCIQDEKCHSLDDSSSNCSSSANVTSKNGIGWWGPGGMDVQMLEDCYLKDSPPGLVSVKYRHPVNLSQPDDVTYLRQASEDILFRSEIQRYDANGLEENIVKFLGFLHPLDAKPLSKRIPQLRLSICSAGSNAVLRLSNDSTSNHLLGLLLQFIQASTASPTSLPKRYHPETSFSLRTRWKSLKVWIYWVNDQNSSVWKYLRVECRSPGLMNWRRRGRHGNWLVDRSTKSRRPTCLSCLGDPGMCAWCEETQTCFLFSTYTSSYAFGKCRDWVDENRSGIGTELCRNCSRHTQCSSCIRDLACGWCSSSNHPANGVCTDGDFSGPFAGSCRDHLDMTLETNDTNWSYSICPDLEECLWNMHDCDENATCHNTPNSYTCECNIGFEGDGKTCVRACAKKCVNGFCSNEPDYQCICDLGWTGDDCSINCGCNNHSTCLKSVGVCDFCQDWTEGEFCEHCQPGSYGDATTPDGCRKCECNGHGDIELEICNSTTGECFCLNNTVGPNCAQCKDGYYGNPEKNGVCFEKCHPRKVITNAVEGRFGSPAMSSESQDCLWLLTIHSVLDMQSLLGPMQSTGAYLQITILNDINIPCPHNHVYVYDGLPNFVASGHPNVLLGAFCGTNLSHPIVATASSGYLTVHFKRDVMPHGFNASYIRLTHHPPSVETDCCGEDSEKNCSLCIESSCPNNCSSALNQGHCDNDYNACLCEKGFGGEDCSVKLMLHHLSWHTPYNHQKVSHDLSSQLPVGRIGHSLVTITDNTGSENLLLFGGYSSSAGYLNDLFLYNTSSKHWRKIVTEYNPPPRHFHAAASLNGSMYIYGGIGERVGIGERLLLGDFWEFTADQEWVQLPEITVPSGSVSLAGATLTSVAENRLVLFGGFSPSYGFFERIVEFDTENKQWLIINSTGAQPLGIYGHSSIYHASTESVYIYGGVSYSTEQVAPTNYLYTFHYPSSQWFRLPPDKKVNKLQTRPTPRYFHTSVVTDNFLMILGGRGSSSVDDSVLPFAYMFSCNLWIPLTDEAIEVIGKWPEPSVGAAATVANGDFYFYGGMEGQLHRLTMPADICLLFSANRVGCMQQTGCAFCSLSGNGVNQTFCFSQDKHSQSQCYNPREQSKFLQAVHCNAEWIEKRDCHQYTSCTDCVASWPAFKTARQACQWCSNCRTGRCVPAGSSCEDESDCNIPRKVINEPGMCPIRFCGASDCKKCGDLRMCIWTRQVLRSSGFGHTLNKMPIYNWVCVMKEIQAAPSFLIESMPPLKCPAGCSHHTDCTSCLQSQGGEGGWHQCVWSETLQACMSPSFELLGCEDGTCGLVVRGNETMCPVPCWQHFQASHCLGQANCGWCAFSGPKVDGRGLCMDGGIMGPTGGICRENQILLNGLPLPTQTVKWFQMSKGPPTWFYLTKPPENECKNGHDTCDKTHEECVDTLDGFECQCKPGYQMKRNRCMPTCKQGCVNGTCIEPDVCQCNFGFVGQNCSTMCKCNGHSNCPGPDELETCLECKNNTFVSIS
ncbi:Multiple epidermal growth factor-like domains protein 8 [Araneus ventricosus]|uniref:Multiple epidermal growth factor-like domains protein 8 n=1 Tax=Araneus ventricosus TaxID=182803 RepID=A0A4Y2K275_ARAVE|nr:Multiple epidermal growth factor-like domains protein 8 [Araneus ventricosus]